MEPSQDITYFTSHFTLRRGHPTIIQLPQVSHEPTPSLVRLDPSKASGNVGLHSTPSDQPATGASVDEHGASFVNNK